MVNDLIFELGCEELPSGAVWPLADEFANQLLAALDIAQLTYGEVRRYATPRRLALVIRDLQAEQASQTITRRGPAAVAAYDAEGKPTQALVGFAKSCGVDIEALSRISTDKGDWIVCEMHSSGKNSAELLPSLITESLANLPIAKPMRWGAGDEEFARPVHWAVLVYGNQVIDCQILGVQSGRLSRGHRFHHPHEIPIDTAQNYEASMMKAYVIADFSQRRTLIKEQIYQLAETHQASVIMPDELLDEVTSIVEWPHALIAHFDEKFLEVPAEALIASMQSHQKCFALKDQHGTLLPYFITVANIDSSKPEQVIAGNEKVMRARLSDADFFFKQDKKQHLSEHLPGTAQVIFQAKLGSLQDKAMRIKALMVYLSRVLELPQHLAERAAELCKCDLLTGMVGEFPELQGLMGSYYALNDGEDPTVAQALDEQYMPRFAADVLPSSVLGLALSLADRIDTLVGIFAIGQKPSGVKDPFKLRRHALAVVRLLVATKQPLNLSDVIHETVVNYGAIIHIDSLLLEEIKQFILDRLQSFYQAKDITVDLIQAVRARQDDCLYDLDQRLSALKQFTKLPEAASLSAACKRVNNLLTHSKQAGLSASVNLKLITEPAEQELYQQIDRVWAVVEPMYQTADYGKLLKELASLREPVDAFFEQVMVMVEDIQVKNNRIALLAKLQDLLQGVADISLLHMV